MKLGFSRVKMTPKIGIELSGYGWFLERRAEKVLDPLFATGVFTEEGENRLCLINCDLVAITKPVSDRVKKILSDKIGIPEHCIMVCATHTHTGPSLGGVIGCGEQDAEYLSHLPDLIAKAGIEAFEKMRTVKALKSFKQAIEPIGFNRVIKDGPVDPFVQGGVFEFDEGRPFILISHACHPVNLGPSTLVSADYPGYVVKAFMEEGYDCVYLNGFCGDINPKGKNENIDPVVRMTEQGKRIAEGYLHHKNNGTLMTEMYLDAFEIDHPLKLQEYTKEDIDRMSEEYVVGENFDPKYYRILQMWAEHSKERLKTKDPYTETITISVFRISDLLLVGFPAEVYTVLGWKIKEAFEHMNIITLSNVNHKTRYIPTSDELEKRSYAAHVITYAYLKFPMCPMEGEYMAEAVKQALMNRYM